MAKVYRNSVFTKFYDLSNDYFAYDALKIFDKLGEFIVSGQYGKLVKHIAGGYQYA